MFWGGGLWKDFGCCQNASQTPKDGSCWKLGHKAPQDGARRDRVQAVLDHKTQKLAPRCSEDVYKTLRDGLSWIKENDLSIFDLILLDPPFNQDYEKKILELLYMNKNLKSSCKIYIEYSKFSDIKMPESFEIIKEKIIGDVKALLIKIK